MVEARRSGIFDSETAASIVDVPNFLPDGTRLGNWLNRDKAKEAPRRPRSGEADRQKRPRSPGPPDRLRAALAGTRQLKFEDVVDREGGAVIVDLLGKVRRVRTVAIPFWMKQSIGRWTQAAAITDGLLLRPVREQIKFLLGHSLI